LLAPVELMRTVGKWMREQGSGRIINTASIAAHDGHPDLWYGITKAGLINATKGYARVASVQGVGVFVVAPGGVEGTELYERIPEPRKLEQRAGSFGQRFTTQDEVADLVVWLAIDAPLALSGQTFNINNGRLLK
jgi:3-oxoacyl-[acyl-carrier protein] reductase